MLELLKGAEDVSGEQIKSELGVSRTAVWKNIQGLQDLGYEIKRVRGKGYQLLRCPDYLYPWDLNFSKPMDYTISHFYSIDSTNWYARTLPPGNVVIAEQQTQGRGRLGRSFSSVPGGIYFSITVTPQCSLEEIPTLPLIVATAVAKGIRNTLDIPADIKWPNDILVSGKKIAGILVELTGEPDAPSKAIIGTGINVNQSIQDLPKELVERATTLYELTGERIDRKALFSELLEEVTDHFERLKYGTKDILNIWKAYSCTLGKEITVKQVSRTVTGRAIDIDEGGALILDTNHGRERVLSGDIQIHER